MRLSTARDDACLHEHVQIEMSVVRFMPILIDQDFSRQTYPTYRRNTTANLKASYFSSAQNGPGITNSSKHNGPSWMRAAEGQSFSLTIRLDMAVAKPGRETAKLETSRSFQSDS